MDGPDLRFTLAPDHELILLEIRQVWLENLYEGTPVNIAEDSRIASGLDEGSLDLISKGSDLRRRNRDRRGRLLQVALESIGRRCASQVALGRADDGIHLSRPLYEGRQDDPLAFPAETHHRTQRRVRAGAR